MTTPGRLPGAGTRPEAATGAASGNAMIVALLVLMVLTAAGVAYVAVTKSEKQISGNAQSATQALYAAESGVTEGLRRMAFPADSAVYIGPPGAAVPGWGRYIVLYSGASALDPDGPALEHDGMDNNEDGQIDESGERYPEVLTKQTVSASTLRYPFVRVEYKTEGGQLARFGDADHDPATPPVENMVTGPAVLRLTAAGERGTAAKTLEVEAVRFPLVDVESAVWVGGHLKFNGNAFLVDGHDHFATEPYDTMPGIAPVMALLTRGPTSDVDLNGFQVDNVMGAGGSGSTAHSPFTYDFNQLWSTFSGMADYSFTGAQSFSSSDPDLGSLSNPKVTVVNGNLSCTGQWSGGGILVVNGDLSMTGQSSFGGIVIATGDVKLAGGGASDMPHVLGGLIFQSNLIDDSKVSGGANVFYSSQAINRALSVGRYTLAWWREK
jgi:hypothetical protein